MDETPYFWDTTGWKRNYHNARSTLVLAVAADGTLLKPSLILKRKSPYTLACRNNIEMLMMNAKNGWMNEDLVIIWLQQVLIPYIQENQCVLLWDSYEAHTSEKVLNF